MTAPYNPQEGSVASRVISYFRRFPSEELSSKDIADRFNCKAIDVLKLLARAVDAQMLKRDGSIFSAGPQVNSKPPTHSPANALMLDLDHAAGELDDSTAITPYTPGPGSLVWFVANFFYNNPDEELTLDDIAEKFNCVRGNIHSKLRPAVESKTLKRSQNNDGEYLYRPGTHIASAMETKPAEKPAATTPRKPSNRVNHVIDFNKLKVEENMPMPGHALRGICKWNPLFDMLKKPDQSIELPISLRTALAAEIYKRHKLGPQRYRVARISATTARIARLADVEATT